MTFVKDILGAIKDGLVNGIKEGIKEGVKEGVKALIVLPKQLLG